MLQTDLVSDSYTLNREHLDIQLHNEFLCQAQANALLDRLIETVPWQQPRVKVWGKWHLTPRLVAFYGDTDLHYSYSDTLHGALDWTEELREIRRQIELYSSQAFNAVLLNYYRNGQDTIGWHADDEAELGERPCIASLSLGTARDMHFRPKSTTCPPLGLNLQHGSLLLMRGETQRHWQHHVPRRSRCTEARVNLTFRYIHPQVREG